MTDPGPTPIIKNQKEILSSGDQELRRHLIAILEAGIREGDPGRGTLREVRIDEEILFVGNTPYDLRQFDRIFVVGAGKGSFPIAEALEKTLGNRITDGIVVVKKGEKRRLKRIEILEAGHPIPDEESLAGGRKILDLAEKAGERDLVFAAVTGGSSALATLPQGGITLGEMQVLNELLLKSGAVIQEMNAVRKHLCRMKGGGLLSAIQPARSITLTLDTAPEGMPWPDMCLPDPTTFEDAIAVLKYYDLWDAVPVSIRTNLNEGKSRPERETLKSLAGMKNQWISVGDPPGMCRASADEAQKLGYGPVILSTKIEGEAREAGIFFAGVAREILIYGRPFKPPCALISSGETTVTIKENCGRGGPNQEFALAFCQKLKTPGRFACTSVDSDGTDGPTDFAGGVVDHTTPGEARRRNLNIGAYLKSHDSSKALAELGGLIVTGHTGTNLQNLRVILIASRDGEPQ
jgi:glycerate 2-kinase